MLNVEGQGEGQRDEGREAERHAPVGDAGAGVPDDNGALPGGGGAADDPDGRAARAASPSGPPRRRILIVDDNADARSSMAEVLQLDGHEVAVAADGAAAVYEARGFGPDVVVLDIGLPDVDGFEVARRLRADPATRLVRIIALTGYARDEFVAQGREAGFDAYVVKPISAEQLTALLANSSGAAPFTTDLVDDSSTA